MIYIYIYTQYMDVYSQFGECCSSTCYPLRKSTLLITFRRLLSLHGRFTFPPKPKPNRSSKSFFAKAMSTLFMVRALWNKIAVFMVYQQSPPQSPESSWARICRGKFWNIFVKKKENSGILKIDKRQEKATLKTRSEGIWILVFKIPDLKSEYVTSYPRKLFEE